MTQPPAPPPSGPPYGLPHGASPPGGPPPSRGAARRVVIVVALLTLGVLLAGVAVFLVIRDAVGGSRQGPAALREPLTFQQVEETSRPPCEAGTVPDTEGATCFRLGPERMTVDRVEGIGAVPPGPETGRSGWAVQLELSSSDGAAFGRLTGKVAEQPRGAHERRIAMIVAGEVISAPSVAGGPITGGTVMITGRFTRSDAEGLVQRMTGR